MAFFSEAQIEVIIAVGLRQTLAKGPQEERDAYIRAVRNFLFTYGELNEQGEKHPFHALLTSLEYISNSDLVEKEGFIATLANSYLSFTDKETDEDKTLVLESTLDHFLRGRYKPYLLSWAGKLDKESLNELNKKYSKCTPILIKDQDEAIWIYGKTPDGTATQLTSVKNAQLYGYLQFPKLEEGISLKPILESADVYADILAVDGHRYPGYKSARKNLRHGEQNAMFAWHQERLDLNFKTTFMNHRSRPHSPPDFLHQLFTDVIHNYLQYKKLPITELDDYVENITKNAVDLLVTIALSEDFFKEAVLSNYEKLTPQVSKKSNPSSQSRVQSVDHFEEQKDAQRDELAQRFKTGLTNYLDQHVLPKIQSSSVFPEEDLNKKLLYDPEIRNLIKFLIPNLPADTKVCNTFPLSERPSQFAHIAAGSALQFAFEGLSDNGVVHLPLELHGHWAHFTIQKSIANGILNLHIHYIDSGTYRPWALNTLKALLNDHLKTSLGDFTISSEATSKYEQDDGYSCGDRTVWSICEAILGENNPWTFMNSQKKGNPATIRSVTKKMLEALKNTDADVKKPANWQKLFLEKPPAKPVSKNQPRATGGYNNQMIKNPPSFFDDHRFVLLLFFLSMLFCGAVIGLGISTFFGSKVIIDFFTNLFPQYAPISVAVCGLLLGAIIGLFILWITYQGLKNAYADIKSSLTDAGKGLWESLSSLCCAPVTTPSTTPDIAPVVVPTITNVNTGSNPNSSQTQSILSQNVPVTHPNPNPNPTQPMSKDVTQG